jgi:hypothetical protein
MSRMVLDLPSISIIMAAYNEENFIEATIVSILESDFPCELIVVNDGSNDHTLNIIERYKNKIKIVNHPANKGKGAAMASGLSEAEGRIIIFCDAHLKGLKQFHLLSLVFPLIYGSARTVLGVSIPEKLSPSIVNVAPFLILTGQRAYFKKDLLPLLDEIENLGYGVETYLFSKFPRDRTALVALPGLIHLAKMETSSIIDASIGYMRESLEIMETLAGMQGFIPKEAILLFRKSSLEIIKAAQSRRKKK